MVIVIPDDVVQAARMTERELLETLAVSLFQQERLTLGQAARLAGLPQIEFQRILASRRIPVHYGVEEFEHDLSVLKELGRL